MCQQRHFHVLEHVKLRNRHYAAPAVPKQVNLHPVIGPTKVVQGDLRLLQLEPKARKVRAGDRIGGVGKNLVAQFPKLFDLGARKERLDLIKSRIRNRVGAPARTWINTGEAVEMLVQERRC